jgi:hypothetical protein
MDFLEVDSMKRLALVLAAAAGVGAMGLIGCEEKKADATKAAGGLADAAKNAAGKAADATKDAAKAAGDKAADAAKAAGDAAKAGMDKAKDAGAAVADKAKDAAAGAADALKEKAVGGLKTMLDGAKSKIEALTKGGETLAADKKPDFTKAMTGINEQFGALTKGFDGLKSLSGDGLMAKVKELTGTGEGLMKTVTETAAKFGIKL